ncbi:uncharacterized abhydrolase domain-containing protein DDB_G0269086-like [Schistocerca piceifrons]|uniref:uncharacterized abhydrolase domain-containing protein DDB_G0269086-like n=1 Tax=Schistocerca piceifrons TaxID=274613 RepID=UPI001F5F8108|nr:uncharacterized abhydrolase domain-containing protein DDB_G0269086-like [Schistocerca piceifrons]
MDTEEQPLVSAGNVETGALSSTSTLFEDIPCENVGAGAQEVMPPPTSAQGEVDKEITPPPEKQEPESGNLPGGYSLQAILERVLDYQAKFAQQQAERDRQQAERDRQLAENLLAQQAERDRQLEEKFLAQQAERDRQLTENLLAQQAERDRQQAERDRQQAERDQQRVQSLEHMKKEIACMKQNYESIPKAVQELTVQVNNLQVANTNMVDEIGVLANRLEKLEVDSTQLVEQKWNEQATKIETEFNSWLEVKEISSSPSPGPSDRHVPPSQSPTDGTDVPPDNLAAEQAPAPDAEETSRSSQHLFDNFIVPTDAFEPGRRSSLPSSDTEEHVRKQRSPRRRKRRRRSPTGSQSVATRDDEDDSQAADISTQRSADNFHDEQDISQDGTTMEVATHNVTIGAPVETPVSPPTTPDLSHHDAIPMDIGQTHGTGAWADDIEEGTPPPPDELPPPDEATC